MSNENIVEKSEEEVVETTTESTPTPSSVATIEPKQAVKGKVVAVKLYGALVDIGAERPGLLHISQLSEKKVQNVGDFVKVGDEVTVYVLNKDEDKGRVELSLMKPPALSWEEMKVNDVVTGEVVRVEKFGAFIEIGAERPGLIHVSELANDYVNSPEDVVKVGDSVEARIINVDRRKKQVDLSIRALEAPQVVQPEEEEDEPMTAMAIALQAALQNSDKTANNARKDKKRKKSRDLSLQDEIIERTLRNS